MTEELYQDLIIDYSKKKTHRGSLGENSLHTHVRNPLCGDDIQLWIEFDSDCVKKVRFSGYGCMISQAAASMMAERIEGLSLEGVRQLNQDFRSLIKGENDQGITERIGDLLAFEGVSKLPARVRCALLAFEALERLMLERSK